MTDDVNHDDVHDCANIPSPEKDANARPVCSCTPSASASMSASSYLPYDHLPVYAAGDVVTRSAELLHPRLNRSSHHTPTLGGGGGGGVHSASATSSPITSSSSSSYSSLLPDEEEDGEGSAGAGMWGRPLLPPIDSSPWPDRSDEDPYSYTDAGPHYSTRVGCDDGDDRITSTTLGTTVEEKESGSDRPIVRRQSEAAGFSAHVINHAACARDAPDRYGCRHDDAADRMSKYKESLLSSPPSTSTSTSTSTTSSSSSSSQNRGASHLENGSDEPGIKRSSPASSSTPTATTTTGAAGATNSRSTERIFGDEDELAEEEYTADAEAVSWLERQAMLRNKKDLKPVDHSTIEYEDFEKDFYSMYQPKWLSQLSQEEVTKMRKALLEDGGVAGKDVPPPISKWTDCGFPEDLLASLARAGYDKPFPIQAQTLPIILSGRDCFACAKTGSGKTAAFVLPMLRHVRDQRPLYFNEGPVALVLVPTRELAVQIAEEVAKFGRAFKKGDRTEVDPVTGQTLYKINRVRCVAVYGGAPISEQIAQLKAGAEAVVATPGRMIDLLCANAGKVTNLRRVTYLVIDEADRMFDLGFEPQIARIIDNTRPSRQCVLFSATFPRTVEALAKSILKHRPVEVIVGGKSVASGTITQAVHIVKEDEKFLKLLEVLGKWYLTGSILIFTDTQDSVTQLQRKLREAAYPVLGLHGGMAQNERESIITDFKGRPGERTNKILVATSLLARGLDVPGLVLVINYVVPSHQEDYVHRIGRTGRAGAKGTAITFITPEEEEHSIYLCRAFRDAKAAVPKDLHAMAEAYKGKVSRREVKMVTRDGYHTKGFKFDDTEAEQAELKKALLAAQEENADDLLSERLLQRLQEMENAKAGRRRGDEDEDGEDGAGGAGGGGGGVVGDDGIIVRDSRGVAVSGSVTSNSTSSGSSHDANLLLSRVSSTATSSTPAVATATPTIAGTATASAATTATTAAQSISTPSLMTSSAGAAPSDSAAPAPAPAPKLTLAQQIAAMKAAAKAAAQTAKGFADVPGGSSASGSDISAEARKAAERALAEASQVAAAAASASAPPLVTQSATPASLLVAQSLSAPAPSVASTPVVVLPAGLTGAEAAKAIAASLASQQLQKPGAGGGVGGSGAGAEHECYSAEVEYNDYPQIARFRVMKRESLADIIEEYGVAITNRGVYIPPGRRPQEGERKLHVLIEGRTAEDVRRAAMELKRRFNDEAANARPEREAFSKYTV